MLFAFMAHRSLTFRKNIRLIVFFSVTAGEMFCKSECSGSNYSLVTSAVMMNVIMFHVNMSIFYPCFNPERNLHEHMRLFIQS